MTAPFSLLGTDLFGEAVKPTAGGPLAQKFGVAPFSVLNAREGEWQERKAAWLGLGITSEVGRGDNLLKFSDTVLGDNPAAAGTSIFDPVLCELAYRWWCPPGGQILDPFAGGSVRGIVAALLGFRYFGVDLRPEQVAANDEQADSILGKHAPEARGLVRWVAGDSASGALEAAPVADFVFSCPPYGDLEQYSDDPRDLSTMEYPAFLQALGRAVEAACFRLRANRFACFVVGDFRDQRTGFYRGFPAASARAFSDAGLALYNEGVLVTSVGSLPVRLSGQFEGSRKLGKTHQNVLVFAKGDPAEACRSWQGHHHIPLAGAP